MEFWWILISDNEIPIGQGILPLQNKNSHHQLNVIYTQHISHTEVVMRILLIRWWYLFWGYDLIFFWKLIRSEWKKNHIYPIRTTIMYLNYTFDQNTLLCCKLPYFDVFWYDLLYSEIIHFLENIEVMTQKQVPPLKIYS